MDQEPPEEHFTRRDFLRRAAVAAGVASGLGISWPQPSFRKVPQSNLSKTTLSFYLDDTNPYISGAEAFRTFLDFVSAEGNAGESSVIIGYRSDMHGLLSRPQTGEQRAYIEQVRRAFECGIDTHMELMTHRGLFDFEAGREPEDAINEGVWLHDPDVSVGAYESYFEHIIEEGNRIGVRFTGVTWPGGGGEICKHSLGIIPNVSQALLNLAKRGRFRGRTVPCFTLEELEERPIEPVPVASDGEYGVYDLLPNTEDYFGIWENDPARVNADYYITADGESGRIVDLVRAGAPYCLFYAHWQGFNPANGVGWEAFTQVVRRVQKFLGDQVLWMRPSEYTDQCHESLGTAGP